MKHNHFELGTAKAICDICARAYKHNELREQWDGMMACYRCYDSKHPDLEPIIAPKEDPMVYNARPRNTVDIDVPGVSIWDGIMYNGVDYGTEFTWDEMDISWDEIPSDIFR